MVQGVFISVSSVLVTRVAAKVQSFLYAVVFLSCVLQLPASFAVVLKAWCECSSMAAWVGKERVESDEWLHTLQLHVCGGSW